MWFGRKKRLLPAFLSPQPAMGSLFLQVPEPHSLASSQPQKSFNRRRRRRQRSALIVAV
jgi:hypothetical protein